MKRISLTPEFKKTRNLSAYNFPLQLRYLISSVFVFIVERGAAIIYSGPVFTKRTQDLVKSRCCEIRCLTFLIALKLYRRHGSCRDACQISERCDHYSIKSRGTETSRNLSVRRLIAKWTEALKTLTESPGRITYVDVYCCEFPV